MTRSPITNFINRINNKFEVKKSLKTSCEKRYVQSGVQTEGKQQERTHQSLRDSPANGIGVQLQVYNLNFFFGYPCDRADYVTNRHVQNQSKLRMLLF